MNTVIEWLNNNTWVFAGIGTFILTTLGNYMYSKIMNSNKRRPIIEMHITDAGRRKKPMGYSPKNPPVVLIGNAIQRNHLTWKFNIFLRNNSSQPAYDVEFDFYNGNPFSYIEPWDKTKPIKPLDEIKLSAVIEMDTEGLGKEAVKLIEQRFPKDFLGMEFKIWYKNEARTKYATKVSTNEKGQLENIILKRKLLF